MKNLIFVLILIYCSSLLFSQVNFELDFNFEKINTYDNLLNLQLVDIDQNGISEVVCFYRCIDGNGLMVVYDINGNAITTQTILLDVNDDFFFYGYYCKNGDQGYIITVKIHDEIYTKIELRDFETGTILGLCLVENPGYFMWLSRVNFCHIKELGEDMIIYLGTSADCFIDAGCSFLYKFLWNEENDLNSIAVYEAFGMDYCEFMNENSVIVLDDYGFFLDNTVYNYYTISLMTHELTSNFNDFFYLSGTRYNNGTNFIYDDFPTGLTILNKNDNNYEDYGLLIGVTVYDSQGGNHANFHCFEPDASTINWSRTDTQIGIEPIRTSTCISVNNEDHYVMYFRGNQLEIRNRINEDIIHNQNSSISPFTIERNSNGQLLFFVEQEDETGYDVYVLEEEIQVSTDENELPIANYKLQNYPNPVNPSTTIDFSIEQNQQNELFEIDIYNVKGQRVKSLSAFLSDAQHRIEGREQSYQYSVIWYGTDQNNKPVSSGIYFYQLKVGGDIKQTK